MAFYSFGPVLGDHSTTFRLWAPKQGRIDVLIEGRSPEPMRRDENGWHILDLADAGASTRYNFVLEDGTEVPDPASRYQPNDVHGPSEVIDPLAYQWKCPDWAGRPWAETVIYELHIGTFTEVGTFRAAIEKLDHLNELGITGIQIMPLADFRGGRNWGYDGVLPYAPDSSYGHPGDLRALIDEAHLRSMSVFLDVVYNHLGPDGNYLPLYAPIFTERHRSPWGAGINFDGDGSRAVRDFFIENALYWLNEFRMDGLRFDAVHAIKDDSEEHILLEMSRRIREEIKGRHVHLILENEENEASLLERAPDGKPKHFTAQWNDDMHHVLHVAATGERVGYYADYAGDLKKLALALAEGFVFQGEVMPFRGTPRGEPSAHLPPTAFIAFIQNHDQIGNRAYGDRLSASIDSVRLRALAAIYLLAPQIPMLFMGEEWGALEPFPFFCDFDDELNAVVREGRKGELARMPGFAGDADDAPDPTQLETFLSAKLRWEKRDTPAGAARLAFYKSLLELRRIHVQPLLDTLGTRPAEYGVGDGVVRVTWFAEGERRLTLMANLGDGDVQMDVPPKANVFYPRDGVSVLWMSPWTMIWFTEP
ncbi:malto-oligosyltrehalose trehalohydrolase [Rhizobium sp. LjRoot254]|uniref:malto-oligosyltrehalose trehalohydrolase n=1 Tax=Rhizobium sp. LjRoot254 TaxID=3342297 RepID=UPI003ECFD449